MGLPKPVPAPVRRRRGRNPGQVARLLQSPDTTLGVNCLLASHSLAPRKLRRLLHSGFQICYCVTFCRTQTEEFRRLKKQILMWTVQPGIHAEFCLFLLWADPFVQMPATLWRSGNNLFTKWNRKLAHTCVASQKKKSTLRSFQKVS